MYLVQHITSSLRVIINLVWPSHPCIVTHGTIECTMSIFRRRQCYGASRPEALAPCMFRSYISCSKCFASECFEKAIHLLMSLSQSQNDGIQPHPEYPKTLLPVRLCSTRTFKTALTLRCQTNMLRLLIFRHSTSWRASNVAMVHGIVLMLRQCPGQELATHRNWNDNESESPCLSDYLNVGCMNV